MVKAPLLTKTGAKNHRRFQLLSFERQDHHSGKRAGLAGGARARRPCFGEPAPPVPHSLFRLFYLVEIRHRQLLQSQSRTRSRVPMPRRLQCEYGDCMIIYLSNPAESTGNRRTAGLLLSRAGFIRSARLLPNSIEVRGRFARESTCADYLSSAVGREGSTVPAAAMAEAGFAEPKPSRRISHVTCETKKLNGFAGRIMLHNS
jgi:hypothetical protein